MAGAVGAGALTFLESSSKRQAIAAAVSAGGGGSFFLLGLDADGTNKSNHLTVENGSGKTIKLHEYYLHWGKVKEPPIAVIKNFHRDEMLFHSAGSWTATGSSGLVTYQLDSTTYLHIMWDCPFNFDFSDNFIGLYLCGEKCKTPTGSLFKTIYQDEISKMKPQRFSSYDLVCCGPGDGTHFGSAGATGEKSWGARRPCEVKDHQYYVSMTMGDRHSTSSKVTILSKEHWPEF